MKRRLCFVGFEIAEIRSIQPALAPIENAWDCAFSVDGKEALEAPSADPFIAVVVDFRMGGLEGVDLMQAIGARHPRTLRIALGDVADRELIASSIGAPFQFVSRPWTPQALIPLIERSLCLDAWLSNDSLRAFVPQLGRLPGLSSTYFEVLRRTESPGATVESIAQIIARDPALTARLLQTVNSAVSGQTEKVTNIADGVSVLGVETVKSLVLCLQVFGQSASAKNANLSLDELWRHSFAVAQLARGIVMMQTGDTGVAGEAFTAGLLHRIGQIVLATNLPEKYGPIIEAVRASRRPLPEEELAQLGVTSDQVGAYLLGVWGMPLTLVEAAALYHNPSLATSREFSVLTAVHVAEVLAHEESGVPLGLPAPTLDRAYLTRLKLPVKADAWSKALARGEMPPDRTSAPEPVPASSRTHETRPERTVRPVHAWLAVAVIVLLLATLVFRRHFAPVRMGEQATASPETRQAMVPTGRPVAHDLALGQASVLDTIKLEAVFFRGGKAMAIINGQTLTRGQTIEGVSIMSIEPASVLLSFNGEQRVVMLAQASVQRAPGDHPKGESAPPKPGK